MNTVFDAKRMIGRPWEDKSLQKDIKYFPFRTVNKDGKPLINVELAGVKKTFTPEEISAMVLTKVGFGFRSNVELYYYRIIF